MSVREAQQRVDSHEFAEWMAYDRLEPFGPKRDDMRSAIIASILANVYRDKKRKPSPFTVEDFMPDFDEEYMEEYVMTPEETLERAKAIFGQLQQMQTAGILDV